MTHDVNNPTDVRLAVNHKCIVDELGYMAARGFKIRAIKIYRAVYDANLVTAKAVINAAEVEARTLYRM